MEEAEPDGTSTSEESPPGLSRSNSISNSSSRTEDNTISLLAELYKPLSESLGTSEDPSYRDEAQKLVEYLQYMKDTLKKLKELEDHLGGGMRRILADMKKTTSSQDLVEGQDLNTLRSIRQKMEDLVLEKESQLNIEPSEEKEKANDRIRMETLADDVKDLVMSLIESVRPPPPPPPPPSAAAPRASGDPISDLIKVIGYSDGEIDVPRLLELVQEVVRKTERDTNNNNNNELHHEKAKQLELDLGRLKGTLSKLKDLDGHIHRQLKGILREVSTSQAKEAANKFHQLGQKVSYLTLQVPPLPKLQFADAGVEDKWSGSTSFGLHNLLDMPNGLELEEKIDASPVFQDFVQEFLRRYGYYTLEIDHKFCLFCFTAFPANAVVKKRLLVHWLIGEDLLEKNAADDALKKIMAHRFINPVVKNHKLIGFKMVPLVHLIVVSLARRAGFFNFDSLGVPTADFSWSHRSCLVRSGGRDSRRDLTRKTNSGQEKLRTIFNVNDPYPDFPPKWFSKLKYLHVLSLGGLLGSLGEFLEIEDMRFLNAMENLKHLRYFSLQGITGITELPSSICGLKSLIILDLKACTNLKVLPDDIGSLENLMQLDVSECYWLKCIPKSLHKLKQLEVLKGFTTGAADQDQTTESCTLGDLADMKQLRKLSISTYGGEEFPDRDEVRVLKGFKQLEKLTIEWRGKLEVSNQGNKSRESPGNASREGKAKTWRWWGKGQRDDSKPEAPETPVSRPQGSSSSRTVPPGYASRVLDKLELHGFRGTTMPHWIKDRFMGKKMCIKGGNLRNFPRAEVGEGWPVKILRLKFLADFEMDWIQLRELFPQLVYFQHVRCPKITFIPHDTDELLHSPAVEATLKADNLGLSWSPLAWKSK